MTIRLPTTAPLSGNGSPRWRADSDEAPVTTPIALKRDESSRRSGGKCTERQGSTSPAPPIPPVRLADGLDHVPMSRELGVGVDDAEHPRAAATAKAAKGGKEQCRGASRMIDPNRLPNESRVSRAA